MTSSIDPVILSGHIRIKIYCIRVALVQYGSRLADLPISRQDNLQLDSVHRRFEMRPTGTHANGSGTKSAKLYAHQIVRWQLPL